MVPEADQRKMTFELQVINGPRVSAPIASQHLDSVIEAFNGYRQGIRVLLQGIGRYSRFEKLESIDAVEHISILDPNDIVARLEEFRVLRNGWLDGKGLAPTAEGLDWLAQRFESQYPDDLPLPYLYPTAEGGVQAEWSLDAEEISLEINLDTHVGEWEALNMETQRDTSRILALDEGRDWLWLAERIRALASGRQ